MTDSKMHWVSILLATGILVACTSCNEIKNDTFEETYSYVVQANKQIKVDTTQEQLGQDSTRVLLVASVQNGDRLVFEYEHNVIAPKNVADGDFSESLYFQVPAGTSSFDFEDQELKQADVYYQRSCFCIRIGSIPVTNGYLRGERISQTIWQVTASLNAKSSKETVKLSFDDIYIAN